MRLHITLLGTLAISALAACQSEEDLAREVLAEALQSYAVMQDASLPTADRLAAGHAVTEALQLIVDDYATTDLGLEIAAGGTVGDITTAGLNLQMLELQDLRAFELCDDQPTPGCIIDRLVAARGYDDRQELYRNVESRTEVFMAVATADTETTTRWFRDRGDRFEGAVAATLGTEAILTPPVTMAMMDSLSSSDQGKISALAAYLVVTGRDTPPLRDLAGQAELGRTLLDTFDHEASFQERIDQLTALEESDRLDLDLLRKAESILQSLGAMPYHDIFSSLFAAQYGEAAMLDLMQDDYSIADEIGIDIYGRDTVKPYVAATFSDPEAEPRDRSVALLVAPLMMTAEELRTAIEPLQEADVKRWDNQRVYVPLIALGYQGDRALFDRVRELISHPGDKAFLEKTWDTGRALAAGKISDIAFEDENVFRATLEAGSAVATPAQVTDVLRDAYARLQELPSDHDYPMDRIQIALSAQACGLPVILQEMQAEERDFQGYPITCDKAWLGTLPAQLSDADFAIYVQNADLLQDSAFLIINQTVATAPQRAYAFVQEISDPEQQADLTGFLAWQLSRNPAGLAGN